MRCVAVCLALFCLAWTAAATAPGEAPWFCHDLDCPKYKVVANMSDIGIEQRQYESGNWASTVVASKNYEKAVATGFWRLFKYISGANVDGEKIAMTAPVIVKVTPAQGPFCEDNFTISFFVPFDHQSSPPTPSDELVSIVQLPPLDVYVMGFGGFATGATYTDKAADAVKALDAAGLSYSTDYFYTAGYDSPFRLRNRHNEVWILAEAVPSSKRAGGLRLGRKAGQAMLHS